MFNQELVFVKMIMGVESKRDVSDRRAYTRVLALFRGWGGGVHAAQWLAWW